jgi:UDP-GlcNAc:undecaprenyl-phosphate GlcNAc-1-phosphate transferase
MFEIVPYSLIFLAAMAAAAVLTPVVIALARRLGLVDPRNARKVHAVPTPRVGGVAIVLSMILVSALAMLLDRFFGNAFQQAGAPLEGGAGVLGGRKALAVLFAAGGFLFLVGVLDDIRPVRAWWKLLAQIAAALVVCAFGIRIGFIPQLGLLRLGWLDWPVTVLWIVAITNAVNLIDGLDGLAAGICAATCAVVAAFAFSTNQPAMGILMLILLGSLAGFLLFNFNPAKVFMGDSGSLFLGFFLATSSILCATKVAAVMGLVLPALALGLPIFDMIFSVLRRLLERRSIFSPDRRHIHHRLLDRGFKQGHAVIVMYLVTLLVAGAGLVMMFFRGRHELLVFVGALLLLLFVFRVAGVLRFREIWNQAKDNIARSREIRRDRRHFETLQDHLRQAWTFDQWWRAVRRMARRMGFVRITIAYRQAPGGEIRHRQYDRRGQETFDENEAMRLSIPVRQAPAGGLLRVEIDVPTREPLETIGRRISLFGRLLDEHSLENFPEHPDNPAAAEQGGERGG